MPPKYVSASNVSSDGHQLQNNLRKQLTEPAISNLNKVTPTPTQSVEDKSAKPKRSPYDHLSLGNETSHQVHVHVCCTSWVSKASHTIVHVHV